ncbi:hypothetical protein C8J57DRAFT_1242022 [Mycena rebaudengoi]|nr:hypothetical protein C8J57DRAFT_1242022 [Mycena rebaudengoi]
MITKGLPDFFENWAEKRERKEYYANMRAAAPTSKTTVIPRSRASLPLPDGHPPPPPNTPLPSQPRVPLTNPVAKTTSVLELKLAANRWIESVFIDTSDNGTDKTEQAEKIEALEQELMAQVDADDAAETVKKDEHADAEDFEEMEGYGMKEICDYEEAIAAYNTELDYFKKLSKSRHATVKVQSKGAIAFLTYLQGYLKVRAAWLSWSLAGAEEAATRMGIPLSFCGLIGVQDLRNDAQEPV